MWTCKKSQCVSLLVSSSSPTHPLVASSISREIGRRAYPNFIITGHLTEANTRLCGFPPLTWTITSRTDVNISNSSPSSSHTSTGRDEGTIRNC